MTDPGTDDAVSVPHQPSHDGPHPESVLGSLRQRRKSLVAQQHLRLPVPRWSEPTIVVVYDLLEHDDLVRAQRKVQQAQEKKRGGKGNLGTVELHANIDTLLKACSHVVGVIDGVDYSLRVDEQGNPQPTSEPTGFDQALAAALIDPDEDGALDPQEMTAREVVQMLFLSDGDVLSHAARLVQWSGYTDAEVEEDLLGG